MRLPAISDASLRFGQVLAAAVLGGLAATAIAPINIFPAAIFALSLLSSLTFRASSIGSALAVGWAFGFTFFATSLQWLTESFSVEPDRFGIYAIPAVLALSALLALFTAMPCAAAHALRSKYVIANAFIFAATWTTGELLRSVLFGGFPWNLIGHIWSASEPAMQFAAFGGVYGLTFVTVLAAAVCAPGGDLSLWPRRILYALAMLLTVLAIGNSRLIVSKNLGGTGKFVRIVQGNVAQADKWRAERRDEILAKYVELTKTPAAQSISAIVWPETAVPFDLVANADVRARIGAALPEGGILFAGTLRIGADKPDEIFNSIVAFGRDAGIQMVYDKVRLVPFGEYMPFRSILPFEKLTAGSIDLSPGHVSGTFEVRPLPSVIPLICYEAIFQPQGAKDSQPRWILNVTNDAWFGRSAGPYQHLTIARFRSIELGLPMVRAANTGISALIDPYGHLVKQIPLEQTGVIDFELPHELAAPTLYSITGNLPIYVLVSLILLAAAAGRAGRTSVSRIPE